MKTKIASAFMDLVTGVAALALTVFVQSRTAGHLGYFFVAATGLFFIAGLYRGRYSALRPWVSMLLLNLLFWALYGFSAVLAKKLTLLLTPLPALLFSWLGHYLARHWQEIPRLRWALLATVPIVAVNLILVLSAPSISKFMYTQQYHEPAPDFEFTLMNGDSISSESLRGSVVVLDFWATWCRPCIHAFPEFEALYRQYREHPNVRLFVVNAAHQGDTFEKAQSFIKDHDFDLPFAYDSGSQTFNAFEVTVLPTTFIIDRSGNVRVKHVGYSKSENLKEGLAEHIETLLEEKKGGT